MRAGLPIRAVSVIALVMAASLLLPLSSGQSASGQDGSTAVGLGSAPLAVAALGAGIPLSASLAAPWAERVGYSPSTVQDVKASGPAVGNVTVSLTLWPSSDTLFAAPLAGAPRLTPAEVGARFGPSQAEYDALEHYFEGSGLHVVHAWQDRLALTVGGSAAAVAAAFRTTLLQGQWNGRPVYFASQLPSLPGSFEQEVAAVSGLSEGFSSFTLPLHSPLPAASSPAQGRTTTQLMPADARSVYGIADLYNFTGAPTYATGEGVALLLWGWGYDPADVNTFFASYFGGTYPVPQVAAYPVDGAPPPSANAPNDPSGAPMELTLDLEWAGTMAPGATLNAVYAPDGPSSSNGYSPTDASLEDALNTAIQIPGVRVVSMSFGGQDGSDTSFQAAFSTAFAAATQEGITLVAASGDNGGASKAGCSGGPAPQFPAASPQVLSVGGTAPVLAESPLGQVTGLDSQSAWNQSGGGYSAVYTPAPSWQLVGSAQGPVSAGGGRGIPDVAGPAADNFLYYSGRGQWAAGTSFAAPLWAGMIAEMDALHGVPLGFLTPHLYSLGATASSGAAPAGLTDVTSGGNCITSASTGWDAVTGWGTPSAKELYAEISYSSVKVQFTSVPSSSTPGGTVSAVVTVLNASSSAPISGLPVSVVLIATSYSGPCGGTLDMATPMTDGNGTIQVHMGIPSCYLGSHATITATVLANGYYGENSSAITVNLLGFAGFLAFIQYFPYNLIAFAVIISLAVVVGWRLGHRKKPMPEPSAPVYPPPPP